MNAWGKNNKNGCALKRNECPLADILMTEYKSHHKRYPKTRKKSLWLKVLSFILRLIIRRLMGNTEYVGLLEDARSYFTSSDKSHNRKA